MAGGPQKPGLRWTRKTAVGSVWKEENGLERLGHESRWAWKGGGAGQGETKAPQMGQGTVGGKRVGAQTLSTGGGQEGVGEGPGSSRGRQNCWPPAALCSWLRNVPSLPGDLEPLLALSPTRLGSSHIRSFGAASPSLPIPKWRPYLSSRNNSIPPLPK